MEFIKSVVKYKGCDDEVVTCKVKATEVDSILKDYKKCLKLNLPGWSFSQFLES